jgi:hypothetical protein
MQGSDDQNSTCETAPKAALSDELYRSRNCNRENTASQQARAFHSDGFLQELQGCTIAICIHCCLTVQETEEIALGIPNFGKNKIILGKAFSLLSRIFKLSTEVTVQPQCNLYS